MLRRRARAPTMRRNHGPHRPPARPALRPRPPPPRWSPSARAASSTSSAPRACARRCSRRWRRAARSSSSPRRAGTRTSWPPRSGATCRPTTSRCCPSWETLPHERLSPRSDTVARRLAVFRRLAHPETEGHAGPVRVLVMPVRALLQPVVEGLGELVPVAISTGDRVDLADLAERLVAAAYTRVDMVEKRGEFAVRGGIIDVFPPTEDHPLRVELWGEDVEEIRWFSIADQRSLEVADHGVWAPPCREILLTDAVRARAAELVPQLPGAVDMLDKLASGIAVEGMESLAPALVESMVPVLDLVARRQPAGAGRPRAGASPRARPGGHHRRSSSRPRGRPRRPVRRRPLDLSAASFASFAEIRALAAVRGLGWWTLSPFSLDVDADGGREAGRLLRGRDGHRPHGGTEPGAAPSAAWPTTWPRRRSTARDRRAGRRALPRRGRPRGRRRARAAAGRAGGWCSPPRGTARRSAWSSSCRPPRSRRGWSGTIARRARGRRRARRARPRRPGLRRRAAAPRRVLRVRPHRPRRDVDPGHAQDAEPAAQRRRPARSCAPDDYVVHEQHGVGRFVELVQRTIGTGATAATPRVPGDRVRVEQAGPAGGPAVRAQRPARPGHQVRRRRGAVAVQDGRRRLGQDQGPRQEGRQGDRRGAHPALLGAHGDRRARVRARTPRGSASSRTRSRTSRRPTRRATIDEVKADMEKPIPMDRLVCGDVGYGKTEIAVRAAFKAVQDGKQVAILVPTTLLVQQHLDTFSERYSAFPVTVKALSRFQSPKESKEVVAGLSRRHGRRRHRHAPADHGRGAVQGPRPGGRSTRSSGSASSTRRRSRRCAPTSTCWR